MMSSNTEKVDAISFDVLKEYFNKIIEAVKTEIQNVRETDKTGKVEIMQVLSTIETRVNALERDCSGYRAELAMLGRAITELEKYKTMVTDLARDVQHINESMTEINEKITDMKKNKTATLAIIIGIAAPIATGFFMVLLDKIFP